MSISLHRAGSGDPVLFVHGIGSRWQVFEPVLDRIARDHEVIAIDLPGFGASPMVDGVAPGPRGYAAWLADWLRAEGIERPHVVGSSMGGGVALELGRQGVAAAVTAFSPVGFWQAPGLRWTQGMVTAMRASGRVAGPLLSRAVGHSAGRAALLGGFFGHPTRVSPEAARADLAALVAAPAFAAARSDFGRYRLTPDDDPGSLPELPVTVAWGTRDVVLLHRTQSARARLALPFARHVDLVGCGHLPFADDPEACARLILEDASARGAR
ncbi:hydrolase [Nocardioides phosphati]|uniref:Hydrolase n=1 Tax=Nocardioides phosphati TaxID=1867775 RepID=A0ABQ2NAS9_9ACTN|nr:alpha/beta hydrolase [Nocardioides phosphati]GGO89011.1 hydrolase [Nocardioides phosphati]